MSSDLTQSPGSRTTAARAGLRFDTFATRVLYIVAFTLGAVSTAQVDLWWLLRAGQDIWHTGHVPLVDHYSHTAYGHYWSNHEWLWEAIAYALHHVGGMPTLAAWTGATAAVTLWLMRRSTHATGYVVPVVLGASMLLLSISWTTRPQVTSMLLFALTVVLLGRESYQWLPPVFLVWANLHAQVVMGGLVVAAALAAACVAWLRDSDSTNTRRLRHLGLATAVNALTTLATPLGPHLWTYVLSANGRPGQDRIAEWASAFHPLISNFLFWALLGALVVLVLRRRNRLVPWHARVTALATLAMTPMAILAVRNIPFFVVAAVPLLLTLVGRPETTVGTVAHWRSALLAFGTASAVVVGLVWLAAPPKLDWHPVPRQLAAALRECPGPLYNDYNEGAALIWWVPDVKVFADNRQDPYPADVIDASAGLDARTYHSAFARYDVRCAYLPRTDTLATVLQHDGWTPTYDDGASVVLVPPRATSATE